MNGDVHTVSSRSLSYVDDKRPLYCTCVHGIHAHLKTYFDTSLYSIELLSTYVVIIDRRRDTRETWMAVFSSSTVEEHLTFWDVFDCHFVEVTYYRGDIICERQLSVDMYYHAEDADTFDMRALVRNMGIVLLKIQCIDLTVIPHWNTIDMSSEPAMVRGRHVDVGFYSRWMSRELKRQYPSMDIHIVATVKSGFSYGTMATHQSLKCMEQNVICRRMKRILQEHRRVLENECDIIDVTQE